MKNINKSVVVGLSGGLGNQLFQYAAGRALAKRLGLNVRLDLSWFLVRSDRKYALSSFNIEVDQYLNSSSFTPKLNFLIAKFSRKFMKKRYGLNVFRESSFSFMPNFHEINSPVYLEGYWQSEKYFKDIRLELLQDFSLRMPMSLRNQELMTVIRNSDSICLHVRRGDYISNPHASIFHGICSLDYYERGVAELCSDLENPHIFIFSDDPHWVRQRMNFPYLTTIVDINGPEYAHWDLKLMTECKHFLIANSSLSWWGAWLSNSSNKRVIAPANWFKNKTVKTQDLLPQEWISR